MNGPFWVIQSHPKMDDPKGPGNQLFLKEKKYGKVIFCVFFHYPNLYVLKYIKSVFCNFFLKVFYEK